VIGQTSHCCIALPMAGEEQDADVDKLDHINFRLS